MNAAEITSAKDKLSFPNEIAIIEASTGCR
jgi:hypothetical protein